MPARPFISTVRLATKDARSALDKYEVGSVLGQGSYAVVKSVKRKSDGERFAMKLIDMEGSDAAEVEHERQILSLLGLHRHIVCLADSFVLPGSTAFVMELAEGGEVFDKICKEGPYSEADAADVVRQVALGVAFIHTAGVVHRDLKPENLLLTSQGVVKLADFGLAERCGRGAPPLHEIAGTAAYMAPEMLLADEPGGPAYTAQVDVFSLGCIVFSLLGGYVAFDPYSKGDWEETAARVEKNEWSFAAFPLRWKAVSSGAKGLIRTLLEPNPSKRLSADEVLTHKWVRGDGVATAPLPGSDVALRHFNEGRKVWRMAASAAAVFVASPLAAAHSASSAGTAAASTGKASKGVSKAAPKASKGSATRGGTSAPSASSASSASAPLPAAVLAELRGAFANFDLDGDGRIDAREMSHAIRALGAPPGEAERLLCQYDVDGDGTMSFEEFTALVQPLHDQSAAALRAAFELFDLDGSGDIDMSELSQMLRRLGFEWQGAHVFGAADTDGNGRVDFEEFVACFGQAAAATKGKGKPQPKGKDKPAAEPAPKAKATSTTANAKRAKKYK